MSTTKDEVMNMLASYNETAEQVLEAIDNGDEYEDGDGEEFLDNWVLSLDKSITVKVWLTFGGPNVYIECQCSKGNYGTLELDSATFIAAWGSDSKETRLDSSYALWRVAERFIENMEV